MLTYLRQRFARVTSSVAYIPQLDGLRALALFAVIIHHVFAGYLVQTHLLGAQSLPKDWRMIWTRSAWVPWGVHMAFGVQLFFAISGFVLALPFARAMLAGEPMPSIRLYLLRRLIRLEPPYLIGATILFLFIVLPWRAPLWHAKVMFGIFLPHYLATITYLHALWYSGPSWVMGVGWTLEIEIQFYLIVPLLAQVFRLKNGVMRRAIITAATLAAGLFSQIGLPHVHDPRVSLSLLGNMEFFLAGILLADIHLHPPRLLRFERWTADLGAIAAFAALVWTLHWGPGMRWCQPLLVAAAYFCVFHGGWIGKLFSSPLLTLPGTMCYSIYLYHDDIIPYMMRYTAKWLPPGRSIGLDTLKQLAVMMPMILMASAVMYLLVERPCVILSHTATRRWRMEKSPVMSDSAELRTAASEPLS